MDHLNALLAFTDADRWVPGIGDPTVMGWITVAGYLMAATLCLGVSRRVHVASQGQQREWLLWGALGLFLVILGVNKQLDLQTWFTLTFRRISIAQGWYEYRRIVQFAFVGFVGLCGAAAVTWLGWTVRKSLQSHAPLLVGAAFLACFVLIRAASFHYVDQLLGWRIAGVKMNWVLELGGIVFITYAGIRCGRVLTGRQQKEFARSPG